MSFAMLNTTTTEGATAHWAGTATAASVNAAGGNITAVNISAVSLTTRWAAFSGNVSASINLTNGATSVYSWAWSPTAGGRVCLSTGTGFNWNTPFNVTGTTNMTAANTLWGFGTNADNFTNTFLTPCTLTIGGILINATNATHLGGSSTFTDCLVQDNAVAAMTDFAYCTNISSSGTNYANTAVNYEVMVPVTGATQSYAFFLELS